jgi:N6-adenosine-specific RNA methylase IME4
MFEIHPIAEIFPRMSDTEFASLTADIKANGLLEPVWIYENKVIDGRHRFLACRDLGITPKTRTYEGTDPVGFVVSLNLKRRHLTQNEAAIAAAKAEEAYKEDAKRRMAEGGKGKANLPDLQKGQWRDKAAEEFGVSGRTVQSASTVVKQGAPELVQAVQQGKVSVSAAADVATLPKQEQAEIVARGEREILQAAKEIRSKKAEYRRNERIEKIVEIAKGNSDIADVGKRFPIILCDPPWRYDYTETEARAIENQYPTMSHDELCGLPIDEVAHEDCVMFMWATSPKLQESMDLLKAWGFNYRTCAVWDKEVIGMGYYFRQQHEILLIATKGNLPTPAPANRPSSVIRAKRGAHSAKPVEAYELIESMYPEFDRLEMFCRSPRNGWSVWGNQSNAA